MPTVSLRNPADVVNASLVQIGFPLQIGDLYDGSAASVKALAIYGSTRDDLMRDGNWQFASRSIALTLLKQAPAGGYVPGITPWTTAYPQQPWLYSYTYPADALKIRIVKPQVIFAGPNFIGAQPYPFSVNNDNGYTPARKTILSNVADAMGIYTGRVTDPTVWDANFAETFVDELGKRLAPALTELSAAQLNAALGADDKNTAKMEQN